jgi:hypothetical protein
MRRSHSQINRLFKRYTILSYNCLAHNHLKSNSLPDGAVWHILLPCNLGIGWKVAVGSKGLWHVVGHICHGIVGANAVQGRDDIALGDKVEEDQVDDIRERAVGWERCIGLKVIWLVVIGDGRVDRIVSVAAEIIRGRVSRDFGCGLAAQNIACRAGLEICMGVAVNAMNGADSWVYAVFPLAIERSIVCFDDIALLVGASVLRGVSVYSRRFHMG